MNYFHQLIHKIEANYKLVLSHKYPNPKTLHNVIIQANNQNTKPNQIHQLNSHFFL